MIFGIRAAVNVETRPGHINVSFPARTRGVVDDEPRLVFERSDGIDMIDRWCAFRPRLAAVFGNVHDHAVLGARRSRKTNAVERKMRVIDRKSTRLTSSHILLPL